MRKIRRHKRKKQKKKTKENGHNFIFKSTNDFNCRLCGF